MQRFASIDDIPYNPCPDVANYVLHAGCAAMRRDLQGVALVIHAKMATRSKRCTMMVKRGIYWHTAWGYMFWVDYKTINVWGHRNLMKQPVYCFWLYLARDSAAFCNLGRCHVVSLWISVSNPITS